MQRPKASLKNILCDGCTLTAQQGIRINTDATLTIYAQSISNDMGKIVATETNHDKAAIGGNKNYRAGELVIHSGNIEASCNDGSKYAAGIGGGYGDGSGMKAITIYSGKVTVQGALYGAGIGGGENGDGGTTIIDGGNITATGKFSGPGIGCGSTNNPPHGRKSGTVTINGGTVVATGSVADGNTYSGAGIGTGHNGTIEKIYNLRTAHGIRLTVAASVESQRLPDYIYIMVERS